MVKRRTPEEGQRHPGPPAERPTADGLEDRIRQRAYELYERRGGGAGDPVEDWCCAEREIKGTEPQEPGSQRS